MSDEKPTTTRHFVRTGDGEYFVQLRDDTPSGFSLVDDDQSFPGGFGLGGEWEIVPPDRVPAEERERLQWLLED